MKLFKIVFLFGIFGNILVAQEVKAPKMEIMLTSPVEIMENAKYLKIEKLSQYINTKLNNKHASKAKYATMIGILTADLFFYAIDGNVAKVEKSVSQLISISKKLGIKTDVKNIPQEVKKQLKNKKWKKLIQTLEIYRRDIRTRYKDEYRDDLVVIVEASAWAEALYLVSSALSDEYDKKKSGILEYPYLVKYIQKKLQETNNEAVQRENMMLTEIYEEVEDFLQSGKHEVYSHEAIRKLRTSLETEIAKLLK